MDLDSYDRGIFEKLYNCGSRALVKDEELGMQFLKTACWGLDSGLLEFCLTIGLDITKRTASEDDSPLHCLARSLGRELYEQLSWDFGGRIPLRSMTKVLMASCISPTMRDITCLCQDENLGVEVFTVFLRSIPSYNVRFFGLRKLLEIIELSPKDMGNYCRAFCRFEIFTRLGMTHTCGYFLDSLAAYMRYRKSWWVSPLDINSKEEIEEEECEFASQLEKMMAEYDIASAKTTEEPYDYLERYLDETIGLKEQLPAEEEKFYRGSDMKWSRITDLLRADELQLGSYFVHPYGYYISTYGERVRCKHEEVCKEPFMLRLLFGEE